MLKQRKILNKVQLCRFFVILRTVEERIIKKKKKLPREFYANGAIKQEENCFFVNPAESNTRLVECIDRGFYILLQGVRGSGKTTRCLYAINHQLTDCCSLYVSLQAMEVGDPKTFWPMLTNRLISYNPDKIHAGQIRSPVTSVEDFLQLFINRELFEEKKRVVLFVDEFDLLLYGEEKTRASFLDALREMRNNRGTYCLHSFVGIGPLKIIDVTKATMLSPFNVSESILTPTFTKEETTTIFKEYSEEYQVQLPDSVIEDIFTRTGGHAGHTCLCGKEIHETLLRGRSKLDFKDWLQFAIQFLPAKVSSRWKTDSRLQQQLETDKATQELLLNYFLATETRKIRLTDSRVVQIAIDLSAVGVLAGDASTNEFWTPSALVRAVIWCTLSVHEQLSIPPPIHNGRLDVVAVIKTGLPLFNRETMIRAPDIASKENRDTGTEVKFKDPVPNEHVYQVELTLLLRKWLSDRLTWQVDTEADSGENDACDIVITKERGLRYVLELVAHATPKTGKGSLLEHYKRAQGYRDALAADEAWVINFTTRHPSKGYLWPEESLQVRAIHLYHKLDWTEAWIVTSPEDKGTLIKL